MRSSVHPMSRPRSLLKSTSRLCPQAFDGEANVGEEATFGEDNAAAELVASEPHVELDAPGFEIAAMRDLDHRSYTDGEALEELPSAGPTDNPWRSQDATQEPEDDVAAFEDVASFDDVAAFEDVAPTEDVAAFEDVEADDEALLPAAVAAEAVTDTDVVPDLPDVAADDTPPAPGRFGSRKRKSEKAPKRQSGKGRKVVGLKIGASQLAAAIVTETDRGHELLGLARRPLAAGIVVDGEVRDESALAGAVRSFFDDEKLPKGNVRIGLSSNRIGVRTLDIDGVEDASRFDNAVRFKAHEVLPVALSESVLDYRVLEERIGEDGSRSGRVLLVVAPRDQVEPYTRVADLAGIGLEALDLEALGLLRAFVAPGSGALTPDDTASVVVSIGHESSTLLVAGGGACEFTRVFDWGGSALEEAIASSLDVRPAEAATILRHLSLSGPGRQYETLDEVTRARATDAIRQRLTPFARELVNSLQFYQTQAESLGIGGIQITGGTSHLEGIDDALHQMIGVNVSVGDPLSRVVRADDFDPALESAIGSFGVPIGLAIDDLSMRGVNLLPKGTVVKKSRALDAGRDRRACRRGSPGRRTRLHVPRSARQGHRPAEPARRRPGRARGAAAADPAGDRYCRRRRRGSSCHGRCERPRWPARVGGGLPRHVEGAAGERLALDSVAHRAGGGEPGRRSGRDARGGRGSAGADSSGDRRLHVHPARRCPSPRATGDAALTQARDADLEPVAS